MAKTPTLTKQISVGCDPEFFLTHNSTFIPAYLTEIQGTKDKPLQLKTGGAVQIDGMALEFNIPPQTSAKAFFEITQETLLEIRKMVDPRLKFHFFPDATFTQKMFNETPSKFKELGCDPDYDAFNLLPKTPPAAAANNTFRSAGGHWHFGYLEGLDDPFNPMHLFDCAFLVRGLSQIDVVRICDFNYKRTKLYGSNGSFRPKPYGFEYRSPSNIWLNFPQEQLIKLYNSFVIQIKSNLRKKNFVISNRNNLQAERYAFIESNNPFHNELSGWASNATYYGIKENGIAFSVERERLNLNKTKAKFDYNDLVKKNFFILNESKAEQYLDKHMMKAA